MGNVNFYGTIGMHKRRVIGLIGRIIHVVKVSKGRRSQVADGHLGRT